MNYKKPLIVLISSEELVNVVTAGACSAYYCDDANLYNCGYALLSPASCVFFDIHKCDPFAAPTVSHGGYDSVGPVGK